MRLSKNPVTRYLQIHDWRWVTTEDIIDATKCTQEDIDYLVNHQNGIHYIEQKGNKYRHIGTYMSNKRSVVEALKKVYPNTLDAAQIAKASTLSSCVGQHIARNIDLLPIEIIGKTPNREYRYVPNDERSLVEMKKYTNPKFRHSRAKPWKNEKKNPGWGTMTRNEIARKEQITRKTIEYLQTNNGWHTAETIAKTIGCSPQSVGGIIRTINNPNIIAENQTTRKVKTYRWTEQNPTEHQEVSA